MQLDWYEPDEDSFTLLDALAAENIRGQVVVDLGCSTGFLSVPLSAHNTVISVDLNEQALLHFSGDDRAGLVRSDLLDGINQEAVDAVVFNPPYVPDYDCPILGGGVRGREVIDRFIGQAVVRTVYLLVIEANGPREVIGRLEGRGYAVQVLRVREILGETVIILKGTKRAT